MTNQDIVKMMNPANATTPAVQGSSAPASLAVELNTAFSFPRAQETPSSPDRPGPPSPSELEDDEQP
ncbi:MAG: hypothetical protein OK454_11885, partial [Thaumarchaeota archaeon]|nr:hypothetical protein [Nitrososphaerota archaeon]